MTWLPKDPHTIARWVRYACYAAVIVVLWHFLSNYSFVRIVPGDDSVIGISGTRSVVLAKYGPRDLPERGDAVVFLMADANDQPIKRAARVAGVPGDRVTAGKKFIEVNGEATSCPSAGVRSILGAVPANMFLLLNDNPFSTLPDSRRTGLIPREVILGRIIAESPF